MDSVVPLVPDLQPHHTRLVKFMLILTTILYVLGFVPVTMMAPISFMAFDAPGSNVDPLAWILVICFLSLPVTMLVAIVTPWIALRHGRAKRALLWSALPLVNVIAIALIFRIF